MQSSARSVRSSHWSIRCLPRTRGSSSPIPANESRLACAPQRLRARRCRLPARRRRARRGSRLGNVVGGGPCCSRHSCSSSARFSAVSSPSGQHRLDLPSRFGSGAPTARHSEGAKPSVQKPALSAGRTPVRPPKAKRQAPSSLVHDCTARRAAGVSGRVGRECPRSCGPSRSSRRDARLAPAGRFGPRGRAALARCPHARRSRLQGPGIELPRRFAAAVHRVSLHDRQLRRERPPLHRRADVRRDRGLHLSGRQITAWRTSPTRRCRARRGRCWRAPGRRPRSGRRPDA